MESQTEYKLKSPPEDGISSVKFGAHTSQFLLVSSWDGTVRLYDVSNNSMQHKYSHDAPVLDACFQDTIRAYSGGLDKTLKMYDLNSASETILGTHNDTIRCVEFSSFVNGVVTGSWDATLKLWDPRAPQCVGTYNAPDKIFAMSLCEEKIVVGTAHRKIVVWDLRHMSYATQKRESSLKYQTRAIKCFPNKQGFVLSTIEGSVAVDYFDCNPEIQKKKYAFKCHRVKVDGMERIYSINAISFHSVYNTFATGGSDGYVNIWDGVNKKRTCQFHPYNTAVSALNFSPNGTILAIGCSHLHEMDTHTDSAPDNTIYIRHVTDQETKSK